MGLYIFGALTYDNNLDFRGISFYNIFTAW